jgi:serine/threonine-protein kinase
MIGQTISHYRVTAKIGAGGMGEVYRATDSKLGRDVALKVLPPAFAQDAQRMARFQREAQVLASLNHPNIATIHGLEEGAGIRALVMELVDGPTLAERIALGPVPVEEALPLAKQIAEALEYAHERGIIHRDLKPANVKITADGKAKVLDFGLAKALSDDASGQDASHSPTLSMAATKAGIILGTAAYMSPEQARGKPADRRADIWSFGVVLYEMLAGMQAFSGDSVSDTLASVLRGEPDWNALPAETAPKLQSVLRRCLQKEPKHRLRDIGDARIEIEELLTGSSSAVTHASGQPERSQMAPWVVVAIVAGLAVLGTAAMGWKLLHAPTAQGPVHLVVALSPNESLARGVGPALAFSPDGRQLVYVARHGGSTQLYLRAIDDFQAKLIPGTESATNPFFSPDGQWIGFFTDLQLKKVPVAGGSAVAVCDAASPWGASWGEDDMIYYAERWQGESILRVTARGGTPQVVSRPDAKKGESSHRWPYLLPGGEALLFTIGTGTSFDDAQIAILNLKTSQWRTLIKGGTYPRYESNGHLVFVRAGTLLAVPFDLKRGEVSGTPVPVLEGVTTSTANGEAQFSLAENGSLAYILGDTTESERKLIWVDRKGAARAVTEGRRPYEDLSLSPDGRRLAMTIEGPTWNVWVYDIERGTLTRLTHEYTNTDPLWTPDGKRIVFTSYRDGKYGLFWTPADGSGPEEQLVASPNFLHPYSFSGDGRLLAYSEQNPQTRADVWVLPMEGERKPQSFLRTPFQEEFPALSPDGQWIAYESEESGRPEIYMQPFSGRGGRAQISINGGSNPGWAPTGRELFYLEAGKFMAVPIETKPILRAGMPRALFESVYLDSGHFYDPSADAQKFVFIVPNEQQAATKQINVVLNWFEELKRRVPTGKN